MHLRYVAAGMLLYGADRDRTGDLCSAIAALSQLSYSPALVTSFQLLPDRPSPWKRPRLKRGRSRQIVNLESGCVYVNWTRRPGTAGNSYPSLHSRMTYSARCSPSFAPPTSSPPPTAFGRSSSARRSYAATRLSAIAGGDVYLKLENQQITGSFKLRGALNVLATLPPDVRARGVVAIVGRQPRTRRRVRGEALRHAGDDLRARAPRRR